MPAYKDPSGNSWYLKFRYKDWRGQTKWVTKRGFSTKREALQWERDFQQRQAGNLEMTFSAFLETYAADRAPRLKKSTWSTKEHILETKLLPYFGEKKLCEITSSDIVQWQNELLKHWNPATGKPYSPVYLRTVHNQLSVVFNHAVRYYQLQGNPARAAGNMGSDQGREMNFWTKEEYLHFAEAMMEYPLAYYCFEVLYWCGIREGELLALTREDVDLQKGELSITKTFHHIKGEDLITTPKTPRSRRKVALPDFLCEELADYFRMCYDLAPTDRLFPVTKNFLARHLRDCARQQGLPQIRVHDLRHSHVSLLIHMGFSAVAIADRMGHESIDITYRYAHLFPSVQAQMASRLNGAWEETYVGKNLDGRGRWRSLPITFRVSPEENEAINVRARLSGLTKQEYLSRRCQEQEVVVIGNPRVYKALKEQMAQILQELQRLSPGASADTDLLETIRVVSATFGGMHSNDQ